jgi:hypothetical protein
MWVKGWHNFYYNQIVKNKIVDKVGQQQILLIVLGVIIVGLAIAVSLQLFRAHSIDEKRNLLINEGSSLASAAMGYYKKPTSLGGGGNSFIGWTVPPSMTQTATGRFIATAYSDSLVIIGTGNEVTTGTDSVKVKITVLHNTYYSAVIN